MADDLPELPEWLDPLMKMLVGGVDALVRTSGNVVAAVGRAADYALGNSTSTSTSVSLPSSPSEDHAPEITPAKSVSSLKM